MKNLKNKATEKTMVENKKGMTESMKEIEEIKTNATADSDNSFGIIIDCDMRPLYRLLLSKCGEDIPTLIVVDGSSEEFSESGYIFIPSLENQSKLFLVLARNDELTMKQNLLEAIEAYQNQDSVKFVEVYHPEFEFDDISAFAHAKSMYEHALKITSLLKIACPQVVMHDKAQLEMGTQGYLETACDESGNELGRIVHIRKEGRTKQISTLAHELRHCWQHDNGKKGFHESVNSFNEKDYFFHKTEIDAEAFSCLYIKEYKGYIDLPSMLSKVGNESDTRKYIGAITRRMEEIQLAA